MILRNISARLMPRALVAASCFAALEVSAQLTLQSGQPFEFTFNPGDIPFSTVIGTFPPQNPAGVLTFTVSGWQDGTQVRYEMFENSPTENSIFSGVLGAQVQPFGRVENAWLDQQGAIRLSLLSGAAVLESFRLSYILPVTNPGGTPRLAVYERTFVPVPEPGFVAFVLLSGLILACRRQGAILAKRWPRMNRSTLGKPI